MNVIESYLTKTFLEDCKLAVRKYNQPNQQTTMTTQELIEAIRTWGEERNIIGANAKATTQTQFVKLLEEVEELNVAITFPNHDELVDAVGDCTVVLILLSELAGVKFEDCLLSAYNEIKGRTGKIVDGAFVKD